MNSTHAIYDECSIKPDKINANNNNFHYNEIAVSLPGCKLNSINVSVAAMKANTRFIIFHLFVLALLGWVIINLSLDSADVAQIHYYNYDSTYAKTTTWVTKCPQLDLHVQLS